MSDLTDMMKLDFLRRSKMPAPIDMDVPQSPPAAMPGFENDGFDNIEVSGPDQVNPNAPIPGPPAVLPPPMPQEPAQEPSRDIAAIGGSGAPQKTDVQKRLEKELEKYLASQKQGIANQEKLAQLMFARPTQMDLSPLAALVDSQTGSNLSKGYTKPQSSEQLTNTIFGIEDMLQKARTGLSKETIDALRAQDWSKVLNQYNNAGNKIEDRIVKLRSQVSSGPYGETLKVYNQGRTIDRAMNEFMKNPSQYTDFATLLGGYKVLQNDNSVVREADQKLAGAGSLIDQGYNILQKAATGEPINQGQRVKMQEAVRILVQAAKDTYARSTLGVYKQAVRNGIPVEEIFEPGLHEDFLLNNPQEVLRGGGQKSGARPDGKKPGILNQFKKKPTHGGR